MKISQIKSRFFIKNTIKSYFSSRETRKYKPKSCFYKILNVSTQANKEEIKKSYLELAKKYHPDTKFGDKIQEVL